MASESIDASASTAVAGEDRQERRPLEVVTSAVIDPECDIVLAWLQNLCASPPDGDEVIRLPVGDPFETSEERTPSTIDSSRATPGGSITSPPSREDAAKDTATRSSELAAAAAARSPDDDGDKVVDQNLANIAAIELLNSCYTLPAEFFAAGRDCHQCQSSSLDDSIEQAPYMISSLSMQCYHCSFPTGLARPRNQANLPWRNGFDGPGGGSGSEPPTEDSKVPPTPNSVTKPVDKALDKTSSLQDIGKYHWFRHGRKRRLPRVLHVTECSHPDEPADTTMKTESDTEESSGPDISKASSALGSVPESEGHRSKTKHMKEVVSKKLHSLGQKLHVSAPDPRPSSAGHTPFRSPDLKPRHFTELGSLALTTNNDLPSPLETEGANKSPPHQTDPPPTMAETIKEAHKASDLDKSELEGDGDGITFTENDSPPKSTVPPNTPASVISAGISTPVKSPMMLGSAGSPLLWVPPNTPQSVADKSPQMYGLTRLPSAGKSSLSRSSTNEDGGERAFKLTPAQETHDHHSPPQALAPKDGSPPRDANATSITRTPDEGHHLVPHPILLHPLPPPPSSEGAASTPSPSSTNRRVSFDVKETPQHEQSHHHEVPKCPDPPSAASTPISTTLPSPIEDKTPPGLIRNWPSSLAASSPGTLGTRPSVTSTSSSPSLRRQSDFVHNHHYLHHHHHHHYHINTGDAETHNLRRHSDVTSLVSRQRVGIEEPNDDDADSEPESEEAEGDWGRETPPPPRPRTGSLVAEMEALWWEHYHAKQRGEVEDDD